MHLLHNTLRTYAWGSRTAIAALLGRVPSGGPEAELWIGAHPDSPSVLADGGQGAAGTTLEEFIAADPAGTLGPESVEAFGARLPFLLKVLAADGALSLQVHPTLEQARAGFAAEEAARVERSAPHRNYRDDNHKPEMVFAITQFEALSGFRRPGESAVLFEELTALLTSEGADEAAEVTEQVAELLRTPDEAEALRSAFARLIAGGDQVRACVDATAAALPGSGTADPGLLTVALLAAEYPSDPGVLISLMLNRVSLAPGESLYLAAGNVHAYLRGLAIEVMASSDNVLRGGLTPKHVDISELLRTIVFAASSAPRLEAEETELGQELYRPPFAEFQLQRIEAAPGAEPVPVAQSGAAVVLCVSGSLTLDSPRGDLALRRGDSAFVPASEAPAVVHPGADGTLAFAVTTGLAVNPLEARDAGVGA
ncbi:mannose-6-phosphate isomerase, class I [Sinomonas mesophila]|uniref:mannose-6-phosphate isomerase, class I n=1 Tax=Sinomonas mesophila TaxID=1531955 RepID=UPI000986A6AE|nr:mannose-6-phosphate isomerase, class I [Sinomonas mesophila]